MKQQQNKNNKQNEVKNSQNANNAPAQGASVNAQKATDKKAGVVKKAQTDVCTYIERMCINRDVLTHNLSKCWKDVTTGTLFPTGILDKKSDFAEFRAYMCKRHDVEAGASPRKGWSVWYALQFAEQRAKAVSADTTHPACAKASAYLRAKRANMQDAAQKLYL